MNVMVTGSGGREHALAWGVLPDVDNLYVAPGNAGTAEIAQNVAIPVTDIPGQVKFAQQNNIDFVIIGPDDQLAAGAVDEFEAAGVAAFGPTRAAAQIESSKLFAKEVMLSMGIPTAQHRGFDDPATALSYLEMACAFPCYIKADGLALGKGSIEVHDLVEARQVIQNLMVKRTLGEAGRRVIIEDHLGGRMSPEISPHALTDGDSYRMFPIAQDHKTIYEDHEGPMTGGMGTISPVPGISQEQVTALGEQIVAPLIAGMKARGITPKGLLYPGIKLVNGQPYVLEINSRFGDPETQAYVRLINDGLLDALIATREGTLDRADLRWNNMAAVCIVLASGGYPGTYKKGLPIEGLTDASNVEGVEIFHAGTAIKNGQVVTNGGRVLGVTARHWNPAIARLRAYEAAGKIYFPGKQYRSDIGKQALNGIWMA